MQLYLSSLAHLLVLIVVADVALGSYLSLLLTNASRINQSNVAKRVKNNIKSPNWRKDRFLTPWTKILQYPPESVEAAVGSRVELHCEVVGNPPPEVYWIEENEPEDHMEFQRIIARLEEIFLSSGTSISLEGFAQISSTYVIDCVRPEDQGLKYCMSLSKNSVQMATTALLVNTTKIAKCNKESQPTITLYHPWRFAFIGSTVIFPCRVVGQPTPYLYWLDNADKTINPATHSRHIVLPNGDLQIRNIEWSDMGNYICKVRSGYTEKSATSFLYTVGSEKVEE